MSKNTSKAKRIDLQNKINNIRNYISNLALSNETNMVKEILLDLNDIEKELNGLKKYGLKFEEHEEQIDEILKNNIPILLKNENLSVKGKGEQQVIIEGDNLGSLYVLNKTCKNNIDLIYIDPPYNTQNKDFVYDDNRIDENDGFRHSKWLSFMEKRLKIAKTLLKDSGVIFISIDDNEMAQLKLLCNDIFGESNYIATVIWERAYSPVNLKKHFSESHDYILCYANNKNLATCNGLKRTEDANDRYKNLDNDSRGPWKSSDLSVGPAIKEKIYEITTPSGRKVMPPNGYCWRLTKERFEEYVKENRIWFGPNGNSVPSIKRFLSEVKSGITPTTIWKYTEVGHSQSATQELKKLFNGESKFTYPKPVELIKRIIQLYGDKDSVVLDFFAGSGTTGHAVMALNAEDNGHRRFILCNNNENNICQEVTFRRTKLAMEKYNSACGLNYYNIDFVDIQNQLYLEYADRLLKHIKNLVEVENGIDFDEQTEIAIVLSDLEKNAILKKIEEGAVYKKIYLGQYVLLSTTEEQELLRRDIKINVVPDYFYGEIM